MLAKKPTVAFLLAVSAFLLLVTPTQAWMSQSQEQNVSQSSSSELKCEGSCQGTSTFKTENIVWQAQSQSLGQGRVNTSWTYQNRYWDNQPTTGEVHLTWSQRGGTCYVRYTEFGNTNYNYSTSTACDNGGITIGGLQPRTSYKFQVKKDDESWSRTMTRRVW